eukprot:scaffold29964_cov73-Cyclotella_meneghiniana.AAC.1
MQYHGDSEPSERDLVPALQAALLRAMTSNSNASGVDFCWRGIGRIVRWRWTDRSIDIVSCVVCGEWFVV